MVVFSVTPGREDEQEFWFLYANWSRRKTMNPLFGPSTFNRNPRIEITPILKALLYPGRITISIASKLTGGRGSRAYMFYFVANVSSAVALAH